MIDTAQTQSESFIATFDILGITQMMLATDDARLGEFAQNMCKVFDTVKNMMRHIIIDSSSNSDAEKESALALLDKMRFVTFSDTIVLKCPIDKPVSDFEQQRLVMQFFLRVIFAANVMLGCGYPIRGCIDFGKVYLEEKSGLFFGRPYVNSLKISESLDFSGVVMTKEALAKYNQIIPPASQVVRVLNMPVPLNTGEFVDMDCLNWLAKKDFERYASQDIRQMLYAKFSARGKRMGENALRKMNNTENTIRAFLIQGEPFKGHKF